MITVLEEVHPDQNAIRPMNAAGKRQISTAAAGTMMNKLQGTLLNQGSETTVELVGTITS